VPYSHSRQPGATHTTQQQFYEVQLGPGATHATQQQFYKVQLGPGVTPAAVY